MGAVSACVNYEFGRASDINFFDAVVIIEDIELQYFVVILLIKCMRSSYLCKLISYACFQSIGLGQLVGLDAGELCFCRCYSSSRMQIVWTTKTFIYCSISALKLVAVVNLVINDVLM